jgi:hypothetical protein
MMRSTLELKMNSNVVPFRLFSPSLKNPSSKHFPSPAAHNAAISLAVESCPKEVNFYNFQSLKG